jgi:hypothetical protein
MINLLSLAARLFPAHVPSLFTACRNSSASSWSRCVHPSTVLVIDDAEPPTDD